MFVISWLAWWALVFVLVFVAPMAAVALCAFTFGVQMGAAFVLVDSVRDNVREIK